MKRTKPSRKPLLPDFDRFTGRTAEAVLPVFYRFDLRRAAQRAAAEFSTEHNRPNPVEMIERMVGPCAFAHQPGQHKFAVCPGGDHRGKIALHLSRAAAAPDGKGGEHARTVCKGNGTVHFIIAIICRTFQAGKHRFDSFRLIHQIITQILRSAHRRQNIDILLYVRNADGKLPFRQPHGFPHLAQMFLPPRGKAHKILLRQFGNGFRARLVPYGIVGKLRLAAQVCSQRTGAEVQIEIRECIGKIAAYAHLLAHHCNADGGADMEIARRNATQVKIRLPRPADNPTQRSAEIFAPPPHRKPLPYILGHHKSLSHLFRSPHCIFACSLTSIIFFLFRNVNFLPVRLMQFHRKVNFFLFVSNTVKFASSGLQIACAAV